MEDLRSEYQNALIVQSACNASGVIRSLAGALDAIWEEARANHGGTEYVNTHPIVVLYLEQLAHLSGATLNHPKYGEAYEACQKAVA